MQCCHFGGLGSWLGKIPWPAVEGMCGSVASPFGMLLAWLSDQSGNLLEVDAGAHLSFETQNSCPLLPQGRFTCVLYRIGWWLALVPCFHLNSVYFLSCFPTSTTIWWDSSSSLDVLGPEWHSEVCTDGLIRQYSNIYKLVFLLKKIQIWKRLSCQVTQLLGKDHFLHTSKTVGTITAEGGRENVSKFLLAMQLKVSTPISEWEK